MGGGGVELTCAGEHGGGEARRRKSNVGNHSRIETKHFDEPRWQERKDQRGEKRAWPSLTNVGPRRKSESRMYSAAAVFAADTSSSVPVVLRALSTLSAADPRKAHT
jgi:hypothetical protein